VQCWKNFEYAPETLDPTVDAVDCPHCGASVPIPEEGDFEGDVDLENSIAEELGPVTTQGDGETVTLGEAAFVEESLEPDFEEIPSDIDEVQVEIEEIEIEEVGIENIEVQEEPVPAAPVATATAAAEVPAPEVPAPEIPAAEVPAAELAEPEAKALTDVPDELDPESVVWKLLIPGGLTYNFHGLQALLRWASGKRNLEEVAVSLDGMRWRNCGKVISKVEAGISVRDALLSIPTLEEESKASDSTQSEAAPSVSAQIAGATEDLIEVINPTVELKGVTIPSKKTEEKALMHEGGVASPVGDTRFGGDSDNGNRPEAVPAVTGQFTFQVETNYNNIGAGKKWAVRVIYTSMGIVIGLGLGGVLHHLGLWKEIFKLISP